jgi:hypothetical protein
LLKPGHERANVSRVDPLVCHHLVEAMGQVGRETETMKSFRVAVSVAMLALIAMPAHAQMGGGGKRSRGDDKKTDEKKPVVDDKAYKAALERIPDPKEKYDPWGVARPAEPAKDAAKKPKQTP